MRCIDRTWGKRRAQDKSAYREGLQAVVHRAQLALERNPDSRHIQVELVEAKERLKALDCGLASWIDQVIQERWAADGDRSTKLFFKSWLPNVVAHTGAYSS